MPWFASCRVLNVLLVLGFATAQINVALAHPPAILNAEAEKGIVDEIKDFRKAYAEAVKSNDAAKVRPFYSESFQHTQPTGKTEARDARIAAALAGEPIIETGPVTDLVIRGHAGGWAATAFGVSSIKSMSDSKTYAVRWSAFYVRTDGGGWHLVASHATRGAEVRP